MATKTQAELVIDVLQHLGVLDMGQSATAEDEDIATKAIDSVYEQLRRRELAPYPLTAIPEWAQDLLRDVVAPKLCGHFGITGQQRSEFVADSNVALEEMYEQTSGKYDPRVVTVVKDY